MLLQQLLRLQFMNSKSSEKFSDLLTFQGLNAVQQRGENDTDIFVQSSEWP